MTATTTNGDGEKPRKDRKRKSKSEAKAGQHDILPMKWTSGRLRDHQISGTEIKWVWPGWLAEGEVSLLAGPSEVGKSTMLAAIAATLAGGPSLWVPAPARQWTTLWYTAEEQLDVQVGPRLRAALSPPGWVCYPGHTDGCVLTNRLCIPGQVRILEDTIHEEQAKLTILDPITSFLGSDCSPYDNGAVRSLIESLMTVARKTRSHIIFTLHDRKSKEGPSIGHVSGCAAWTQTPRTVIRLGRDDALVGRFVLCAEKGQVAGRPESNYYTLPRREGVPVFCLGQTCNIMPDELDLEPLGKFDKSALEEAKSFIKHALEKEPRKASTLQAMALSEGLSWMTIRRAAILLGVVKERVPHESTWYSEWSMPKGGWPV